MINKIKNDIKAAMRSKDIQKRDILRMIMARAKTIAKDDNQRDVTDKDIFSSIQKQIKQNKETITHLKTEGRDISKESLEISILTEYLPKQMSESEMKNLVSSIIEDIPKDERTPKAKKIIMGKLSEYRDQLDMKEASNFASTLLS